MNNPGWLAAPDLVLLQAWAAGETGYPLVDATMRALVATGYLNFRMRALLVVCQANYEQ